MPVTATITFSDRFLFDEAENISALLYAIEGIVDVEVHDDEDSGD